MLVVEPCLDRGMAEIDEVEEAGGGSDRLDMTAEADETTGLVAVAACVCDAFVTLGRSIFLCEALVGRGKAPVESDTLREVAGGGNMLCLARGVAMERAVFSGLRRLVSGTSWTEGIA